MKSFEVTDYSLESYEAFLAAKKSPIHRVEGNRIYVEDFEYNDDDKKLNLAHHLWDYQQFIVTLAILKKRFAIFANIGLGKTAMFLEWVRHVSKRVYPKKTLILTQLHLIQQTLEEQMKFYNWTNIVDINSAFKGDLHAFLDVKNGPYEGCPIGIVNIEKFNKTYRLQDDVGAVVLDESGCLKDDSSIRRTNIIVSCKGIPYKLCCTAVPAPNDRMEYANHALHLGYIDNYKQFFQKYFFNTGNGNEYVLRPYARKDFYAFLSTWSVFLRSPVRYGFNDNLSDLMPPELIWERIPLTEEQKTATIKYGSSGQLHMFTANIGGITSRSKVSQISKGFVYHDNAANQ